MIDLDSPKLVVARTEFKLRMSRLMRELGVERDKEELGREKLAKLVEVSNAYIDGKARELGVEEEVNRRLGLSSWKRESGDAVEDVICVW